MEDIIAIIMVFGVPLSIIFSITYLRAKSMQLKARAQGIEHPSVLAALQEENQELKSRIENLEMIMSDSDLLKLKNFMDQEELKEQTNRFKKSY